MKKDYREDLVKYVTSKFEEVHPFIEGDVKAHIVSIGVSVLETKFPEIGPGFSGGSFVQAIAANDLMEAISRADNINCNYLKFYCTLMYCFGVHSFKHEYNLV